MKTTEGNKLIAEFMRVITPREYDIEEVDFLDYIIVNPIWDEDVKYHSSWDWLMPVVEKIEELGYTVTIAGVLCKITVVLDIENPIVSLVLGDKSRKKELVWLTVCEFIEWYNKNK
jgi:hypothetical protein